MMEWDTEPRDVALGCGCLWAGLFCLPFWAAVAWLVWG